MENKYCVYKHTTPHGKVYIGLTGRVPRDRWKNGHGYKRSNPHFWRAILKYGWNNIKHEILLEGLTRAQASEFEKMYICLYKSYDNKYGYNKTFGGECSAKMTYEALEKISGGNNYLARAVEQYSLGGEYIKTFDSISSAGKELRVGKGGSIGSCASGKIKSAYGYIWIYADDKNKTDHIKKKMQDTTHGANSVHAKAILQYDKNGNFINRYETLTEAANSYGAQPAHITQCARGDRLTTHGFIWLYADDTNIKQKLKAKIREKKHSSKMCGGANHQARAVEQYTNDGKYITTYPSATIAAEKTGIGYSTIKSCAGNGRSITAGGFIWIHSDEKQKLNVILEKIRKRNTHN